MEEKEIWKDVVGWEGYYQVSNLGRVRSVPRTVKRKANGDRFFPSVVLVLRKDKDGYNIAHLRDASTNRDKMVKVHRMVAEAFVPNNDLFRDSIDHINGIRDDNRVENLRWCTISENANYPVAKTNRSKSIKESYNRHPELRGVRSETFRKAASKVVVKKDGVVVGVFESHKQAAKELGINGNSISAYITGRLRSKVYEFIRIEK